MVRHHALERRPCHHRDNELAPDPYFDRQWGFTVLEAAAGRLRNRYVERGKSELFDRLQSNLGGSRDSGSYKQVAIDLHMTEGAVRVAVHRLRQEFGELLRDEIAKTVFSSSEIDEEIRHLWR